MYEDFNCTVVRYPSVDVIENATKTADDTFYGYFGSGKTYYVYTTVNDFLITRTSMLNTFTTLLNREEHISHGNKLSERERYSHLDDNSIISLAAIEQSSDESISEITRIKHF